MTQNLLREYRALGGGTVMGIYGAYHTSMTSDDGVQTMGKPPDGGAWRQRDLLRPPRGVKMGLPDGSPKMKSNFRVL